MPHLPDDLIKKMQDHPEIDWDKLLEETVRSQLALLENTIKKKTKSWKSQFFDQFCGIIDDDLEEVTNLKEIWVPDID